MMRFKINKKIKILKKIFWAFIPARGSSKTIKFKNLVDINGKKLISFTFDILKKNKKIIKKIYCSSEDKKIQNFCKKYKIEIDYRDKSLSKDNTSTNEVIYDFIKRFILNEVPLPEFILLCEPTSPFLRSKDILDCCNKILKEKSLDSVQTVTKISSNSHAFNQRIIKNNLLNFYFNSKRKKMYNKQLKPSFYIHGNLRVFKTQSFLKYKNIFGKKSYSIIIPKLYAYDLDDKEDLKIFKILQKSINIK
jgi:CMP-N-acetylneuraminic acid synthetase